MSGASAYGTTFSFPLLQIASASESCSSCLITSAAGRCSVYAGETKMPAAVQYS
jgi:hypothetical protein